jgi:cytochrome c5
MRKVPRITFPLLLMAAALLSSTAYSSNSECGGVFKKKCSKCHTLPSPLGYSKQAWDDYVKQMADEAKLSKPEVKCIMGLNTTIIPE